MGQTTRSRAIWLIIATQWIYWATVAIAVWATLRLPLGIVRTILVVGPILSGSLIFMLAFWLYRSCDEYIRLQILKAVGLAAIATAMWTLAYSCLELAGFPRLSMMWVGIIGWGMFVLLMLRLKFMPR